MASATSFSDLPALTEAEGEALALTEAETEADALTDAATEAEAAATALAEGDGTAVAAAVGTGVAVAVAMTVALATGEAAAAVGEAVGLAVQPNKSKPNTATNKRNFINYNNTKKAFKTIARLQKKGLLLRKQD